MHVDKARDIIFNPLTNGPKRAKEDTMSKRKDRGQALVIVAVGMVAFIALLGMAIDGGNWTRETVRARTALDTACVHAATVVWRGGNGWSAFQTALQANGYDDPSAYSPNEGNRQTLIRGYQYDSTSSSIYTAMAYETPTYFLQIVGVNWLPVRARERCTTTGAFITPIAVKTSAFYDSLYNGTWISVVGQRSQADIDSGANYRGVVFPFLWCVNSAMDYTPNTNCPYAAAFYPLTGSPPSAQTAKNALMECWSGLCDRIYPPVGMRLATVSGTSNRQLCMEATDAGLVPGTDFVAIIYDGEVITPDPSYGNWENVGILGWGTFRVVDLRPNLRNCNELVAIAIGGIYTSPLDIPEELFPREIPWDAQGGW